VFQDDEWVMTYPNVGQSLFAIEAEGFESTVTQHLEHLGVFLTFFFEGEFALLVVVFVFASTPIFTTLEKRRG
jgi:hypothetical protein